jgi:PST family polysaccharide transporter
MLRFGGTLTLNGLVVYLAYNLEKVLLGRTWGADALGIYGRAYQLINLPTDTLNSTVGGVAFSALSRLQDDPDRLKSYFLKGYALVMSMTLPITAFCALYADNLILVLLGPKWNEAAVLFRLMTPTILIFGMINPCYWLLVSSGLQVRSLKIAFVIAPLVITSYVIGLPFGPKGVAIAFSTAMTLWLVPHIIWCVHGTTISLRDLLRAISLPFLSSVAAAVLSVVLRLSIDHRVSALTGLVVGGGVMCASYLCMLLFVFKQKSFYFGLLRGSGASQVAVDDPVRESPGA